MSEKATITAMREWLKTCPLIAEEQSENGAAFRISGLSPEPRGGVFLSRTAPPDPVDGVFTFRVRNRRQRATSSFPVRDYSEARRASTIANKRLFVSS